MHFQSFTVCIRNELQVVQLYQNSETTQIVNMSLKRPMKFQDLPNWPRECPNTNDT